MRFLFLGYKIIPGKEKNAVCLTFTAIALGVIAQICMDLFTPSESVISSLFFLPFAFGFQYILLGLGKCSKPTFFKGHKAVRWIVCVVLCCGFVLNAASTFVYGSFDRWLMCYGLLTLMGVQFLRNGYRI